MLDLGVRARRAIGGSVAVPCPRHGQLPQPAVLGVPVGHVERWQLRGDQRQPERALFAELGGGGHRFGPLPEQPGHLLAGPQVRTAQRGQPSGGGVQGLPRPDGTHRHGQPAPRRPREMRPGGGDDADAEARREGGQRRVAFVVERVAVVGQLDADPVRAEAVHQVGQRPPAPRPGRRRKALGAHGLCGSRSGCASARRRPRSARRRRSAACPSPRRPGAPRPAAATAAGNLPGRGPAPAGAGRADPASRCGPRAPATVRRRTRCAASSSAAASANRTAPYRPSWSVSARARRSQPGGLLDQLLRRAGPVEEAERRMRVQLGVCNGMSDGRAGRPGVVRRPYVPRLCDRGASSAGDQPARRHGAACCRAPAPFPPSSAAR